MELLKTKLITIILLTCCLNLIPVTGYPQDVSLDYGVTQAGYSGVLENPTGFGAHLNIPILRDIKLPIIKDLHLRLSLSRHTESITITRSSCTGFILPGTRCPVDTFDSDTYLAKSGGGIVLSFSKLFNRIEPEFYLTAMISYLGIDFEGRETGKTLTPYIPEENPKGYEFGGKFSYNLTRFVDTYVRISIQHTNIEGQAYDTWAPFWHKKNFYQFGFGFQFRISELLAA